ncbi:hypothetical protein P389DRAFT_107854 [Cystobasidium minutum MCA 4210]|uniref:uncharacterized protein n=1 Tax=Cystobasidium minutum MCA 4210 TaxID=1397322 RepID=UPI0034CF78FF|eukprot:jgi/Rhomi1/107854/CE107853_1533
MNRLAPPGMGEMPPGGGVPGVPLAMQTHHMGPPPIPPPGMAAQSQEAQSAAEFTHLCTTFGDCIEALPPTLTRSISDLRELDAVLSGSISTITEQLNELLRMLEDPKVLPEQRFHQLRRLADEAKDFRLGGEDKIRVATGTCETLIHHTNQLDVLAGLLSTLLPSSMAGTIPPPSWPHGYPILFPTQASASGSAYRKPDFLPTNQPYGRHTTLHHDPTTLGYTYDNGQYTTRHADAYAHAANNVRNYVREGAHLPDENRIKQHVKKQRQDASLQAAARARNANPASHLPTSEHKHRGGKPVAHPNTAAYAANLAAYGGVPSGSNHAYAAQAMAMAPSTSAQGHVASPLPMSIGIGGSNNINSSNAGKQDGDVNFIPYANKAHPRTSFDKAGDPLPPNYAGDGFAAAPASSNASVSNGAASVQPAAKKRRTSNKDKQASQSDYGDAAAGDHVDEYVPPASLARERQNSSRGAGGQSPVVGGNGAKRSRNNSKKGAVDSPDPASSFASAANGNGKGGSVATSFAAPLKRKGSQLVDTTEQTYDPHSLPRPSSRTSANAVPALVHDDPGASETDHPELDGDLEMIGDDGDEAEGDAGGDDRTYCYCDRVSFGNMIGCDGEDCAREWFHLACVGMDTPPKGEWYCDDCLEKRKRDFNLNKKKR